jgi:hypothetical protein
MMEMEMDYPESIRSEMFDWYGGLPSASKQVEPRVKDVTPCSEYTRYTVEGILKDPRSELSALMDVEALGPIFVNSDLKDPKWSPMLGYGMAVVGEDTRIHIHRNGKYIIRRALDREHAESTYKKIVNLVRPALLDTQKRRFVWDRMREGLIGEPDLEGIAPFVMWPQEEGDLRSRLERIRDGAKEVDAELLSKMREAVSRDDWAGFALFGETIDSLNRSFTEKLLKDVDTSFGRMAALIWARTALRMAGNDTTSFFKEYENWEAIPMDVLEKEPMKMKLMTARLHYLLFPVY